MEICPLYTKIYSYKKIEKELDKDEFDSSSRTPFVSRFGYPNISVGVLAPPGVNDATNYDAPRQWSAAGFKIPEIIELRSSMVNSRFPVSVKQSNKELEKAQEISMAQKAVTMDVALKQRPKFRVVLRPDVAPMGPNADLKGITLTENPRVPRAVDKAVSDGELKATEAFAEMSRNGIDEGHLTRLLSVGLLGMKKDRKLVPTRWSITAVDDNLGKQQIQKIKDFKQADFMAFFGGYLGNNYLIMMFPGIFSYELFEMSASNGEVPEYATDFEDFSGRKEYAHSTAGGYYAARLAITEKLVEMKRQASILVLRFITDEYSLPLGVWVVREASRKAMASRPIEFASQELMLDYARLMAKRKFGVDVTELLSRSKLLDNMNHQKTLSSFS